MGGLRLAMVVVAALAAPAPPQTAGTADAKARAAFDRAMGALRDDHRATAARLFREAIEADPRFVAAHEQYIETRQDESRPEIEALYEGWAAAHPDNPVYEWGLAKIAGNASHAAEAHLRRAIAIDSSFAPAHADLAMVAELKGDSRAVLDSLKRASDLDPSNAAYAFRYAYATKAVDPAASNRLLQQVADRFPGTDEGARALYWATFEMTDVPAKLAIFERLRTAFPPEHSFWSESAMNDYFDLLTAVDPGRARALAADMQDRIRAASERKIWDECAAYASALAESAELRAKGDGRAALRRLDGVKPPRGSLDETPLGIARAAALEAAGDRDAAYALLLDLAVKAPSDAAARELTRVGAALDRDPAADLRVRREAASTPAPPFTLRAYPGDANVSLADYKGRVVLIAFWYPSCGPCRDELPILQRVLDKYKDRVAVLALNVRPDEKDLAGAFLANRRFGFRLLETTGDWAETTYGVTGVPATFLVDDAGRVVLRPRLVPTARYERMFELQIESLFR